MGKWEEKKISEVVEFSGGSQPPKSTFSKKNKNGFIRLIQIRDYKSENHVVYVEKSKTKKFCSVDDIMIGRYGPPVFQILKGLEGAYNVALMKAIPKEEVLSKEFLFKFLENPSIQSYIVGLSQRSAGQSGVNKKALEDYPILIPPLQEQQRIVAKLDGLFANIDQAIGLLEENIAHTHALMGSVLDGIFDKVFKENKSVPLLKHVEFIGGSQPPKSVFSYELKEGYIRLIQIRDYKSDNYLVYIKEDSTKKFCNESDVMIGRYGPPVFQILRGLNGAYNVALMKAVPDEKVILKDYLYYFLMNGKIQSYIISISQRSAGQSGVNKKALEAYEIAIPSLEEQRRIVDTIKSAIPKIDKAQELTNQNLENLKSLKNSLLDQAFKGEL